MTLKIDVLSRSLCFTSVFFDRYPHPNICNSFNINCNFVSNNVSYICETRGLFINQREMKVNEVSGTHSTSNSNDDVTELVIVKSSMSY